VGEIFIVGWRVKIDFFFSKNGVQTVNNNNFLKLQQLADMAMRTNHRTTSAASIKCNVYQPKAKIVLLTRMKMQMLFSGKSKANIIDTTVVLTIS
jgi:hypothetical protein